MWKCDEGTVFLSLQQPRAILKPQLTRPNTPILVRSMYGDFSRYLEQQHDFVSMFHSSVCSFRSHKQSTRESKWGQKCHFWQVNVLTQQQPADPAVPRLPDACARPVTPSDPGNRFPCHPDELRWHCPNWPAQSPSPLRTAHSPADHRGQHHWRTNKTHQHIITACISIWINVPLLLLLMCVYSTFEIQWNGMFSQLRNVHGTLSTHKKLFISPRSCLNFTSQGFRRLVKVVAQLLTSNTSINPGEQQI